MFAKAQYTFGEGCFPTTSGIESDMTFKSSLLLVITLLTVVSCSGQTNKTDDPIVLANGADPELENARKEAMSMLGYFITSMDQHSKDTLTEFYVKMDFVDKDEHEHMWVFVYRYEKDMFHGYLANVPTIVKNAVYGQPIEVRKSAIEDWMILDLRTDKREGAFSSKVLSTRK